MCLLNLVDNLIYSVSDKNLSNSELRERVGKFCDRHELSISDAIFVYNEVFNAIQDEHRIAKFERVSGFPDDIPLPERATVGSAGYDFFAPEDIYLNPGESKKIDTGIRCAIMSGWVLKIYPRSGLGFKYHVGIANTVGIIDSDYYYSDNEGHIKVKIVNNGDKIVSIHKGEGFCQGIFSEYGLTIDDNAGGKRNGGFGSTTK